MAIEVFNSSVRSKPNIFPMSPDAVTAVARPLFDGEEKGTWQTYLNTVEPRQRAQNPNADLYLGTLSRGLNGLEQQKFRIGVALAFDVLTECAREQGLLGLPILSTQFVEQYSTSRGRRLVDVYGQDLKVIDKQADREEEFTRTLFTAIEKKAYEALDMEIAPKENEAIFDNTIFMGFVMAYFLYREGLSESVNRNTNATTIIYESKFLT